jgi:hypothetical protein
VLDTIKRLSANLTPGDLDHTLERITAAAVEVLPGVHYASITVKHADGAPHGLACLDGLLEVLDLARVVERDRRLVGEQLADDAHVAETADVPRVQVEGTLSGGPGRLEEADAGLGTDACLHRHRGVPAKALVGGEVR